MLSKRALITIKLHVNYKMLHSHPSRWHCPIQCTEYSHYRKLGMFFFQHSEPGYRQWFMVAKVNVNHLRLRSICRVILCDSGPIPAVIFSKLSTTKHSLFYCGQEITFVGLILKDKNKTQPWCCWNSQKS